MKLNKKKLSQEKYDEIKHLLTYKLTAQQIADISKKSVGTIATIKRSKDYEDYFAINRAYWKKESKPLQEIQTPKPTSDFDKHNSIVTLLRAIEHDLAELIEVTKTSKKGWPW